MVDVVVQRAVPIKSSLRFNPGNRHFPILGTLLGIDLGTIFGVTRFLGGVERLYPRFMTRHRYRSEASEWFVRWSAGCSEPDFDTAFITGIHTDFWLCA